MSAPLLGILALLTAAVGALGGLGGAVLLVPLLVVFGVPVAEAAPLGLLSVAAGSLSAGSRQVMEQTINHRLGVLTEIAASAGAIGGALVSGIASDALLRGVLAITAASAAIAGGRRKGIRNPPQPGFTEADVGEWRGRLAGAYRIGAGIAPYEARRIPVGLVAMMVSGVVAGLAGASGGFIKTPATSEVMHVPVKVAASTTTFSIGVTSAAGLLIFALQGRIDATTAAPVLAGAIVGGSVGAALQSELNPPVVRRALSVVLLTVALVLVIG